MIEQGSDEWFASRAGKVTASRLADVMAKIKTGEAATRKNYKAELICERLTGIKTESFTTKAMEVGTDREPVARALFEAKYGLIVDEVGFIDHPTIANSGASPDGLIGLDGLLEIKCPNRSTHLEYFLDGVPPAKYIPQMMWQMASTGRKWCDFASYNPDFPEHLQLFVVRLHRDDDKIREMESEVMSFLNEVEVILTKLKAKYAD